MQMNDKVLTALEVLRDAAENEFEKHRIDVLEKDLTDPPKVEIVDETHQKFDGVVYHKDKGGHYVKGSSIHRTVYSYCCGEIPNGYKIHHKDLNPANNDISNLQMLTETEHQHIHFIKPTIKRTCAYCGNNFIPKRRKDNLKYCSRNCYAKAKAKKIIEKICPICKKTFQTNKTKRIYCSRQCFQKSRQKSKTCPICKRIFKSNSPKRIYCSQQCYQKSR